ncbi:hypothetical protein [Allopontixanthobacter sediminis]|uniref:Uncharacterized protein n=1 Tax=Allopontixanthobacter sediminis TaxID=1689985 RepID=A0A845B5M9_9SPHN|nr:hypothetical protein [Allopontixanthobacter sediminis]MXP42949.1 hypothetical protein [Allopontixanthobacter sediminis]
MSEHTKGPWVLDPPQFGFGAILERENGGLIFGIACGDEAERKPEAEIEANARLIAAAPELLEALERCVDALASLRGELEPPLSQVVKARAAIAKATGDA